MSSELRLHPGGRLAVAFGAVYFGSALILIAGIKLAETDAILMRWAVYAMLLVVLWRGVRLADTFGMLNAFCFGYAGIGPALWCTMHLAKGYSPALAAGVVVGTAVFVVGAFPVLRTAWYGKDDV